MNHRWLSLVLLCHLIPYAFAQESAYRDPKIPYTHYVKEHFKNVQQKSRAKSAMTASHLFKDEESLPKATQWTKEQLEEGYKKIRDERYHNWTRDSDFPRRTTWLYPTDGCYARAGAANLLLKEAKFPAAKKVFAFGSLSVDTEYTESGHASWWYHVALIVEVEGVKWVMDPSVDHAGPLHLTEWLDKIGDPEKIKVSICEPGTYLPRSSCSIVSLGTMGPSGVRNYLSTEWDNLVKLGKDPSALLGDAPPWGK